MRVLIAGLGSIGRRHLANVRLLEPDASITIWHQHSGPSDGNGGTNPGRCDVYSLEGALDTRPDVALITGPATTHIETALALADAGVHLLVEKPLSHSLDGVDSLIEHCDARHIALLVGYNLRFSESLQVAKHALDTGQIGRVLSIRAEVGQYLPDWRPDTDYRRGVSARSELGGGALLELSHEIDYVRWLVGDVVEVSARVGHLSDLETDVEDVAEILLGFTNGAIGSVHLDMVQRVPTRTCRVIGSEGTVVWDGLSDRVDLYSSTTKTWTVIFRPESVDRNYAYVAELKHFFDCAAGTAAPLISGIDGRRVVQIAMAARQSSVERRAVHL